jgi:hypothetical protein
MAGDIFISYRRDDTSAYARLIFNKLVATFSQQDVFMDVDSIAPGADFTEVIAQRLTTCSAVVAIIGKNWENSEGRAKTSKLKNPSDFVRIEIESALKQNVSIIPVLVDGAQMPRPEGLPESLKPFCRRNAIEVGHVHFDASSDVLVQALSEILHRNGAFGEEQRPKPEKSSRFSALAALLPLKAMAIAICLATFGIGSLLYFKKIEMWDGLRDLTNKIAQELTPETPDPTLLGAVERAPSSRPSPSLGSPGEKFVAEVVPFVTDRTRQNLAAEYEPAAEHKAIALNLTGDNAFFVSQQSDEAAKNAAIERCQERASAAQPIQKCELYAVGDKVVYPHGRPPMPPLPWIRHDTSIERAFAAKEMPLLGDFEKAKLESRYVPFSKSKSIALSPLGGYAFRFADTVEESVRRSLETCGAFAGIPCMIVAIDNVFVVPVPTTFMVKGFFHAGTNPSIAPDARKELVDVMDLLADQLSGWSAVAVGKSGRPRLALKAASEQDAVNEALTNCAKSDSDCDVIAIGPFSVGQK